MLCVKDEVAGAGIQIVEALNTSLEFGFCHRGAAPSDAQWDGAFRDQCLRGVEAVRGWKEQSMRQNTNLERGSDRSVAKGQEVSQEGQRNHLP